MGARRNMEFWFAIAKLVRSWRVIIPALLIGLSLGATAYLVVPTHYVSATTMVLTTTEFGGTESRDPSAPTELVNPMLTFSESLRTSADMLIWSMSSIQVKRLFDRDGPVDVTVNDGRSNPDLLGFNGPIVYITGESTDPKRAREAVDQASEMMRQNLLEWQAEMKAPSTTYITLVDVVPTTAAAPEYGLRVKVATLALLGGIFLTIAAVYGWTRSRARRALVGPGEPDPGVTKRWWPRTPAPRTRPPEGHHEDPTPPPTTNTQPAPPGKGKLAAPVGVGSK